MRGRPRVHHTDEQRRKAKQKSNHRQYERRKELEIRRQEIEVPNVVMGNNAAQDGFNSLPIHNPYPTPQSVSRTKAKAKLLVSPLKTPIIPPFKRNISDCFVRVPSEDEREDNTLPMASSVEVSRASTPEDNTLPMASSIEISRVNSSDLEPQLSCSPYSSSQSSTFSLAADQTRADTPEHFYEFPCQSTFPFQLISRLNRASSPSNASAVSDPLSTASDDEWEDTWEDEAPESLVTLSIIDDLYLRFSDILQHNSLRNWMDNLVLQYLRSNDSASTAGDHFTYIMMPRILLRDLQLSYWALQPKARLLSRKGFSWFRALGLRLTKALQWIDDFVTWVERGDEKLDGAYSRRQLLFQTDFLVTIIGP